MGINHLNTRGDRHVHNQYYESDITNKNYNW